MSPLAAQLATARERALAGRLPPTSETASPHPAAPKIGRPPLKGDRSPKREGSPHHARQKWDRSTPDSSPDSRSRKPRPDVLAPLPVRRTEQSPSRHEHEGSPAHTDDSPTGRSRAITFTQPARHRAYTFSPMKVKEAETSLMKCALWFHLTLDTQHTTRHLACNMLREAEAAPI